MKPAYFTVISIVHANNNGTKMFKTPYSFKRIVPIKDAKKISSNRNEKSFFFYPKIKGELEQAVKKLPFKKTQIFQPPILIRQPELIRNGEKIN